MDDRPTHSITITMRQRYIHGGQMGDALSVTLDGEGDVDHWEMAVRAALLAAGFSPNLPVRIGRDD